ncbi:hypothetical protein BGX24_001318 [Mortierella sp. AD032]|nr:hypothetical protein BGX24_001318 [Mortierella sp. AD032]
MYRVHAKTLVVAQRARNPTLLVATTVAVISAASLATKTAHCQHDSSIQAEADELKGAVQDFADHVLQLSDSPYDHRSSSSSSSSSSLGRDRGHSSPFFSSMGHRSHRGFGFGSSDEGERDSYRHHNHADSNNVSTVRRGASSNFRGSYVEEPLVPALFYITVAGLTGSILARRSNFVFRFLSPLALALGASAYCIPKTTNNLIHGLRTYDYTQWSHDMQHKYFHAKKSLVDTTHGLTSAAGSMAGTVHLLKDVKDKTVHVAHDLQDKGQGLVDEAKHLGHDLTHKLEHAKDHAKDSVEGGAEHAKHWWNSEKKVVEKGAKDLSNAARRTGEDAKDWARSHSGFDRHDVERGFDRFKTRAQDGWENARDEVSDAFENGRSSRVGRDARRKFDSWKDSAEDWAEDSSREARGSFERAKDNAKDWTEDRRHDARRVGRDVEDHFDDARHEFKQRGREAREFSEDRFRDARRDIRNRAEDVQDHGRRQFHKFEREVDDHTNGRGWGFGGRNTEDFGGRRGRYEEREEYGGRGGGSWNIDSQPPRQSVTEAAKEGKHWWSSSSPRHNSAADPYESYDRDTTRSSSWWKAGSGPSTDRLRDNVDDLKHQARRSTDRLRDNIDDKVHESHSWLADTKHDLNDRLEHAKHDLRNKFAHEKQGRDFGGFGRGGHNHESIYSHDNWFHYDHGEDATATAGGGRRGRGERGL